MVGYSKMLDRLVFNEGGVRYVGGKRGIDEPHMNVFAVDIHGSTYFGEIRELFLADRHNFNLEVVSFGWVKDEWFGTEPDPRYCAAFTTEDLSELRSLIAQAVSEWIKLDSRPVFLSESARSHFLGEIFFRDGWSLIKDESGI